MALNRNCSDERNYLPETLLRIDPPVKRCETFSVIYNKTEEQTKDRIFSNININDEDNDDNCVINYRVNENKMIFIMILFKNLKQTSTFFVKYIDPLSF